MSETNIKINFVLDSVVGKRLAVSSFVHILLGRVLSVIFCVFSVLVMLRNEFHNIVPVIAGVWEKEGMHFKRVWCMLGEFFHYARRGIAYG